MSKNFTCVLVKPQLGENIGATARVLKNFGFSKLILINPRDGWPNKKAESTSSGAIDIIKKTKIFDDTKKALGEYNLVFSFSARKRSLEKKHLKFKEFLNIVKRKRKAKIGLVFGPESTGLTNLELSLTDYIVSIPTSKFNSINLSHSVNIVFYEIFKTFLKDKRISHKKLLSLKKRDLYSFTDLLIKNLEIKNFFEPKEKKRSMVLNINNLFNKLQINDKELRILASIVSALSKNKF
tara:strand:+ start:179 stop:892 length:714 start_codon:yes stop_codon:yes gene_type:complete